ncbi:MAG: sugar-binding domain-containing protein, partial [Gammaproteobacteria bacterium]
MNRVSLSGTWEFRLENERDWRPIPVPGCWEAIGIRKDTAGPAWYRARFVVPKEFRGQRIWIRFGAVSYRCVVTVNGQQVGTHIGMWDAFAFEVTHAVQPGEAVELLVQVEKPASLTNGPDSAAAPGNVHLRETLAGFLPYVWGHAFGGIWQDVELVATAQMTFEDVT